LNRRSQRCCLWECYFTHLLHDLQLHTVIRFVESFLQIDRKNKATPFKNKLKLLNIHCIPLCQNINMWITFFYNNIIIKLLPSTCKSNIFLILQFLNNHISTRQPKSSSDHITTLFTIQTTFLSLRCFMKNKVQIRFRNLIHHYNKLSLNLCSKMIQLLLKEACI